jgi:hypothetical protein
MCPCKNPRPKANMSACGMKRMIVMFVVPFQWHSPRAIAAQRPVWLEIRHECVIVMFEQSAPLSKPKGLWPVPGHELNDCNVCAMVAALP